MCLVRSFIYKKGFRPPADSPFYSKKLDEKYKVIDESVNVPWPHVRYDLHGHKTLNHFLKKPGDMQ